ncbi:MAG: GNAT family N-acetyltransferase [Desulfobacteraceae bacterium]|nr:GNAT family N-acetyltransferase [Desulfobacteraceae bacterium]
MEVSIITVSWDEYKDDLFSIRQTVFIEEQNVPEEEEIDEFDPISVHVLAKTGDQYIGTGRVLPDGHIGRIAVLKDYRSRNIGSEIMLKLIGIAETMDIEQIELSAQVQAMEFYKKRGFCEIGHVYMEAGIEHIRMVKKGTVKHVANRRTES